MLYYCDCQFLEFHAHSLETQYRELCDSLFLEEENRQEDEEEAAEAVGGNESRRSSEPESTESELSLKQAAALLRQSGERVFVFQMVR